MMKRILSSRRFGKYSKKNMKNPKHCKIIRTTTEKERASTQPNIYKNKAMEEEKKRHTIFFVNAIVSVRIYRIAFSWSALFSEEQSCLAERFEMQNRSV